MKFLAFGYRVQNKAVSVPGKPFKPSLILASMATSFWSRAPFNRLPFGKLLALLANIKQILQILYSARS